MVEGNTIEKKIDTLTELVVANSQKIEGLTEYVGKEIGTLGSQVGTLTKLVGANSQKIESLGKSVGKQIEVLTEEVGSLAAMTAKHFAIVEEKLGTLEADVEDTNKRITDFVTPEIERHGLRIKTLEQATLPG